MWEPQHLTTLWAFTACYRDSFTFTSNNINIRFEELLEITEHKNQVFRVDNLLEACNSFHNEVVTCQCSCFIKTTDFHLASKRNTKWLCAEHTWKI
jgi:hypothetical protein